MTATHEGPTTQTGTSSDIRERRRRISTALEAAGIAQQTNSRSTELSTNAKVVLERRYLSKDREGNVLEDSVGMFRRVAENLSQADRNYGATEEQRQITEDKFFLPCNVWNFYPIHQH